MERLFEELCVKNIVLPAVEETRSLWMNKFGFKVMSQEEYYRTNGLIKGFALLMVIALSLWLLLLRLLALMCNIIRTRIVKEVHSNVSNVKIANEFEYIDPVDGSVSKHQVIRYLFEDGSRLVFRLSGTGSEGATIRVYKQYENDSSKTSRDSQEALKPLVDVALKLSKMQEFTGRSEPTVIT